MNSITFQDTFLDFLVKEALNIVLIPQLNGNIVQNYFFKFVTNACYVKAGSGLVSALSSNY